MQLAPRVFSWRASVEAIEDETDLEFPDVLVEHDTFDSEWARLQVIDGWQDLLPFFSPTPSSNRNG